MFCVKETARKITCPTESDEMNLKRVVRYLKGAPSAKSLIEITTPSKFVNVCTDSDWAGQATTSMVKNTANSKFEGDELWWSILGPRRLTLNTSHEPHEPRQL